MLFHLYYSHKFFVYAIKLGNFEKTRKTQISKSFLRRLAKSIGLMLWLEKTRNLMESRMVGLKLRDWLPKIKNL